MSDKQREAERQQSEDKAHSEAESAEAGQAPEAQAAEDGAESASGDSGDELTELQQALEEARARAEENWNECLRARAEMQNIQRRAQADVEKARKYAVEKIAGDLLGVKDSLEMGVKAAKEEGADPQKLLEGSELTLKMLSQVLERFNVQEIDPQGERFNPEHHEAVAAQPSHEHEPNTVLNVMQKGYALHDRVLRPAMVVVSQKAPEPPPSGSIDEQA
ncbi:nucleotide exchange factor GrpE [Alkalilimnicola ehrlichii MLHE-1]|uniref:Protein GrpE n=1 Tax=Alkalilimnicola ehrlichii (strain ATCC BAA-1101 / DSM 17681 / MLHE-1) TaxID=187272 RepID=GRPE_ALKEH|nr:nucleotide exchange factor GrpE [Alkalilimnicola ehrlichii]Q0A7E2.1 RecName: Full=Protein GrpE; AltName: Full=HSP-70 cofactor [Alkalilimnicola ehrlichii MLHE-1]ABI57245.1 GrpE protein [Alkalilimnicola ehrlichii MLHE-1]